MKIIQVKVSDDVYKIIKGIADNESLPVATWARTTLVKMAGKNLQSGKVYELDGRVVTKEEWDLRSTSTNPEFAARWNALSLVEKKNKMRKMDTLASQPLPD